MQKALNVPYKEGITKGKSGDRNWMSKGSLHGTWNGNLAPTGFFLFYFIFIYKYKIKLIINK